MNCVPDFISTVVCANMRQYNLQRDRIFVNQKGRYSRACNIAWCTGGSAKIGTGVGVTLLPFVTRVPSK